MWYDPHIRPKPPLSLRTNVAGKPSLITFKQLARNTLRDALRPKPRTQRLQEVTSCFSL